MEVGMEEPCIEGVAIHGGPESCVGVCEGAGEALTGVRAGWAIEPRNQRLRGADAVTAGGRQHRRWRYRESPADPARSKNLGMHAIPPCARTGRSHACPPRMAGRAVRGRLRPEA